jgi:hypothetical protein
MPQSDAKVNIKIKKNELKNLFKFCIDLTMFDDIRFDCNFFKVFLKNNDVLRVSLNVIVFGAATNIWH